FRPGYVGALADVDEQRPLVDVARLHAGEPQRARALQLLARRHPAQRLRYGADMLGRGAAAAAGEVEPSGACPFADLARHRFGRVLVLAERVRQTGVGMAADARLGDPRELLDVRPQLVRAERAVE